MNDELEALMNMTCEECCGSTSSESKLKLGLWPIIDDHIDKYGIKAAIKVVTDIAMELHAMEEHKDS